MRMIFYRVCKTGIVALAVSLLSGCGPAVRTANGDCYYRGKGLLSWGGVLLDGVSAYADAQLEALHQQDQINLQKLGRKLDSIDTNSLKSDEEISHYNRDVDEYNRLLAKIEQYQEQKQQELKDGPQKSFSQLVDESGDCQ